MQESGEYLDQFLTGFEWQALAVGMLIGFSLGDLFNRWPQLSRALLTLIALFAFFTFIQNGGIYVERAALNLMQLLTQFSAHFGIGLVAGVLINDPRTKQQTQ